MNELNSKLLERAVTEVGKLPGVGRKTAMRLVLHLLRGGTDEVEALANALVQLKREVKYCQVCHNLSDTDTCPICADKSRDASMVCVVEDIRDVMVIENTMQYHGLYHVLGGLISPMDGIGPSNIQIDSLCRRIETGGVKEVIFALSSTMEGDTTAFYIFRQLEKIPLKDVELKYSTIARGISVGEELEYADELTLGRSIINRIQYNGK